MKEKTFILSIDNLNLGGAQTQIKLLEQYLYKQKCNVKIITCYPGWYSSRDFFFIKKIYFQLYLNILYFFRIFLILASSRNATFISFLSKSNFFFLINSLILGCSKEVYFSFRNHHTLWRFSDKLIIFLAKSFSLKLLTNSELYFRFFRRIGCNSEYTPNMLVESNFYSEKPLNYSFISVCRVVSSKRIQEMFDFIQYFTSNVHNNVDYTLYLRKDDDDYLHLLNSKMRLLKGLNNLNVKIYFDQTPDYSSSRFLLHFSTCESSSNVILEAISNNVYPIMHRDNLNGFYSQNLDKKLVLNGFQYSDYELIYQSVVDFCDFDFDYFKAQLKIQINSQYKFLLDE
jgi:hypothetical protein